MSVNKRPAYSARTRAFIAIAWTPKGAMFLYCILKSMILQSALSGVAPQNVCLALPPYPTPHPHAATVQAALSGVPLHMVRMLKTGAPNYEEWLAWGHQVRSCVCRVCFACVAGDCAAAYNWYVHVCEKPGPPNYQEWLLTTHRSRQQA